MNIQVSAKAFVSEAAQKASANEIHKRLMGGKIAGINIVERKQLHDEIARLSQKVLEMRVDNRNLLHAVNEKDLIIRAHEKTIRSLTDTSDGTVERRPAVEIIMAALEDFPRITYAEIMGVSRSVAVVEARHTCIYAVKMARPDLSLPQIGRIFGGRDHTSIIHAVRKMEKLHECKA
ncbi:chromosomal replication initiation ATPase DnaA [Shinella sp. BE166]|uniref:helix-turn-helix domain-containing protein n=1 Tax=Shinella sp. BE166 TaxID=3373918 RepID=UPI003EBFAE2F